MTSTTSEKNYSALALDKLNDILNKYKNDEKMLEKVHGYINTNLTNYIEKIHKTEENRKITNNKINNFIDDFFIIDNNYFYIAQNGTFIYYDDLNYKIIDEDDLIEKLYVCIEDENDGDLNAFKHKIKNTIIKRLKETRLEKSIPESDTITYLNNFFVPILLPIKNKMKYLYCMIGDSILKRKTNKIYYFNIESKEFVCVLESLFEYYFDIKLHLNVKYKYHKDHDYNLCRILNFNISIKNRDIWENFLKDNIFNFYVVSCYYSIRYGNSEEYLKTLNDKNDILFLKNNTQEDIINLFIKKMLENKNTNDGEEINQTDMYFLWKIFIQYHKIPNVIYKNEFLKLLSKRINNNNNKYVGYYSEYLKNIKHFKTFWENTMCDSYSDELEISELHILYNEWFKNKYDNTISIDDDKIIELICYFYPDTVIDDNKYILHKINILWDKQGAIEVGLENKFNKDIKTKISMSKLYKYYCSYCKKNKQKIASKNYFINVVHKIIPEGQNEYIKNNMILKKYWDVINAI